MVSRLSRPGLVPLLLFIISFAYYALLSSKQFTWIFGSGDSGDWLASALTWQPPQPLGNPLYVLFGHAMAILPGDLVVKMTVIGSCLTSAITVTLVYFIVTHYTKNTKVGILSAGVLLASAVFLSQATVLSQYPLPVMLVVLSFWFYLKDKRELSVLCLGAGTAMHIMVGAITLLWLAMEWRQGRIRDWVRLIPLYVAVAVIPYSLTLWELWMSQGTLNISILSSYISNTAGAGGLALSAFPLRLGLFAGFVIVSLGIAVIPAWRGVRAEKVKGYWLMIVVIGLVSWYYLTALDTTVWHYLPWTMPFLAIFAGVGMSKMREQGKAVFAPVLLSVVVLLAANAMFLNANAEAAKNPVAMNLYREYASLPYGSEVDVPAMGWKGFVFRYVQAAERPDLVRVDR